MRLRSDDEPNSTNLSQRFGVISSCLVQSGATASRVQHPSPTPKRSNMATPAIDVKNLTKNYGPVLAVDDVSFQVQPGELVGFLGPNGAGKSTCMRVLTTWLPASSGYAWLSGFDVMYQSMEVRQRIGYLPESVPLYPEMRVREYLAYRAKLKGVERAGRSARIDYCLAKCQIKEVRNRLLGTLSKGYRQRVGLADALLADPPILILDEPTSGLDPVQINETLNTIKELRGRHTVLLSTHILPEVEKVCERVIIIDKGRIKLDETLKSIEAREPSYVVEVRGPAEVVTKFLREQSELTSVEVKPHTGDLTEFEVKAKDRKDPRESLAAKLIAKGWSLRRLEQRKVNLEAMFNEVVRSLATQEVVGERGEPAPCYRPNRRSCWRAGGGKQGEPPVTVARTNRGLTPPARSEPNRGLTPPAEELPHEQHSATDIRARIPPAGDNPCRGSVRSARSRRARPLRQRSCPRCRRWPAPSGSSACSSWCSVRWSSSPPAPSGRDGCPKATASYSPGWAWR